MSKKKEDNRDPHEGDKVLERYRENGKENRKKNMKK